MSSRAFLGGFGAGLVFAAGFLLVFPPTPPKQAMTAEQIRAAAFSQDLVVLSKQEYDQLLRDKQQGGADKTAPAATASQKPQGSGTAPAGQTTPPGNGASSPATTLTRDEAPTAPQASTPPTPPTMPQGGTMPTPPSAPTGNVAPTAPKPAPELVTVYIPYRTNATQAAAILVKAGLLPQNNGFVQLLREKQLLNRIRVGTYRIAKGTPPEEIARILTTPPAS